VFVRATNRSNLTADRLALIELSSQLTLYLINLDLAPRFFRSLKPKWPLVDLVYSNIEFSALLVNT
jgi:hypothetical protein